MISAFEAKYGIKVSFTRGDSQVNATKLLNEYKAGRVIRGPLLCLSRGHRGNQRFYTASGNRSNDFEVLAR